MRNSALIQPSNSELANTETDPGTRLPSETATDPARHRPTPDGDFFPNIASGDAVMTSAAKGEPYAKPRSEAFQGKYGRQDTRILNNVNSISAQNRSDTCQTLAPSRRKPPPSSPIPLPRSPRHVKNLIICLNTSTREIEGAPDPRTHHQANRLIKTFRKKVLISAKQPIELIGGRAPSWGKLDGDGFGQTFRRT